MSFWSKLGKGLKVAAPFAAALIPGVGPLASTLIGAGMGAGGSALDHGSLAEDMLYGAGGAAGGATKYLKPGSTASKVLGKVTGMSPGGGSAADPGTWASILENLPGVAGKAIEGGTQAAANNRGAQASALVDINGQNNNAAAQFNSANMDRQKTDMASQDDAWKKLQQSSYVKNNKGSAGGQFSPYTRAIAAPSDDVKAGADALMGQTRDSLMSGRFNTNGGAPLPMPVDRSNFALPSDVMNPGTAEKIGNFAGPGLDAWSTLLQLAKKRIGPNGQPLVGTGSGQSYLGTVNPSAGT